MAKRITYLCFFVLAVFRFLPLIYLPEFVTNVFSSAGFVIQYVSLLLLLILFFVWRKDLPRWFSLPLMTLALFCAIFPRVVLSWNLDLTVALNNGRSEKDLFSPVPGMHYVARNASRFGRNEPKFVFRTGIFMKEELIVSYSSFQPDMYEPYESEIYYIYPNGWYWYRPSD
jgi:hypothetical protein